MELEIEVYITKDETQTKRVEIETPAFTMATETAFTIGKELGASCMMVYLTILSHRNQTTNRCFPSIATISKETNLCEKTVKKCLTDMEKHGDLLINSGYKGISNNYYFPHEAWFNVWQADFYQWKAERRHGKKSALEETRQTKLDKAQKRIAELEAENEKLRQQNGNGHREIPDDILEMI